MIKDIAAKLNLEEWQVKNCIKMIDDENTVHFIARYRKDNTGNLDENSIRSIIELKNKLEKFTKAKEDALLFLETNKIQNTKIKQFISDAVTISEIEQIIAPFKKSRETKADIAKKKGFYLVAMQIKKQAPLDISPKLMAKYDKETIINGAKDILEQEFVDDIKFREKIKRFYTYKGVLESVFDEKKLIDDKIKKKSEKFKQYKKFSSPLKALKSHQILALNRGEKIQVLKVKILKDKEHRDKTAFYIAKTEDKKNNLYSVIINSYNRVFASVEKELRNELTDLAEKEAILVFQKNIKELLMLKTNFNEQILAIDPGFKAGCKIAVIDKKGEPILFDRIYLHKEESSVLLIKNILNKYKIETIVVGNGTASKETLALLKNIDDAQNCKITIVNESGASVYSTSQIGGEEFPNLDSMDRGTVSIGRRYIDSLSELVKIPVESIGVGMYQHDINPKILAEKLSYAVEDVVNLVGINVNLASPYLLRYVSGITKRTADKIYKNRPYKTKSELGKILTPKTFEQCIGFLRIPDSPNIFDNTSIHPQQYEVAKYIIEDFEKNKSFVYNKNKYPTISKIEANDIVVAYQNMGKELRAFKGNVESISNDIIFKVGNIVRGIVRNITSFGVFVDIGMKHDGLIHISNLSDKFVKDPADILSVGESVSVKIIDISENGEKVQLKNFFNG